MPLCGFTLIPDERIKILVAGVFVHSRVGEEGAAIRASACPAAISLATSTGIVHNVFRWRDGRVADRAGLENRRAARLRGFESLSLRQFCGRKGTGSGWMVASGPYRRDDRNSLTSLAKTTRPDLSVTCMDGKTGWPRSVASARAAASMLIKLTSHNISYVAKLIAGDAIDGVPRYF